MLCVHRLREGLKEERTACVNRIRGLLAEFGIVVSQSPKVLREALSEIIEDAENELSGLARLVIERAQTQWRELDEHMAWCDARIGAHVKDDCQAQTATHLNGVGPVTASAVVATVGDFKQFKNGAQFGAWLGLTPKQNSSGGKNNRRQASPTNPLWRTMGGDHGNGMGPCRAVRIWGHTAEAVQ